MAFECKERDIKTCKQLQGLGLCQVYKNKRGKQACKKVSGARSVTLDDIAHIRGLPKPSQSVKVAKEKTPEPIIPDNSPVKSPDDLIIVSSNSTKQLSGPIKTPEVRIKTPSPLKPHSTHIEADSILATGIHHTLVEPIINIDNDPLTSITDILNNTYLKTNYNNFIETLNADILQDMIDFYELIHSDNFLHLIKTLIKDKPKFGKIVRIKILSVLNNSSIKTKSAPIIFRAIYNSVMEQMDTNSENTSIVVKTAKNVQTSDNIRKLGIDNYRSIIRNFTNFRPFIKDSASNSIILTATLSPPADSLNSVKARNTLKPDQQFYLKIFPLGDVVKENDDLIEFDTLGLLAEYKMYNELFKLVKYNITPNILCKVAAEDMSYFSNDFLANVRPEIRAVIKSEMIKINTKLYIPPNFMWDRTGLIVTMPGGRTFSQYFQRVKSIERKQLMFQLLYTFYVFDKLKISHGDIHTDNIFVTEVPPTDLCYIVEGVQYRFTTTKLVKIYDFDHAMIEKDTNIRLDTTSNITINKIVNYDRSKKGFFNENYGECSIYNKNLDLVISILNGIAHGIPDLKELNITRGLDVDIEEFMRDILPGINGINPISSETINETYVKAFKNASNIEEAKVIFDTPFVNIAKWVPAKTLKMTWDKYFNAVQKKLGRIVKSFSTGVPNNHLWIPDNVILPKLDMLRHPYFRTFITETPINVREQIVYTIDNRVM